eukprot:g8415.t1
MSPEGAAGYATGYAPPGRAGWSLGAALGAVSAGAEDLPFCAGVAQPQEPPLAPVDRQRRKLLELNKRRGSDTNSERPANSDDDTPVFMEDRKFLVIIDAPNVLRWNDGQPGHDHWQRKRAEQRDVPVTAEDPKVLKIVREVFEAYAPYASSLQPPQTVAVRVVLYRGSLDAIDKSPGMRELRRQRQYADVAVVPVPVGWHVDDFLLTLLKKQFRPLSLILRHGEKWLENMHLSGAEFVPSSGRGSRGVGGSSGGEGGLLGGSSGGGAGKKGKKGKGKAASSSCSSLSRPPGDDSEPEEGVPDHDSGRVPRFDGRIISNDRYRDFLKRVRCSYLANLLQDTFVAFTFDANGAAILQGV